MLRLTLTVLKKISISAFYLADLLDFDLTNKEKCRRKHKEK